MPVTLNIPCPERVLCDTENPFANLTSEGPDQSVAISIFFPVFNPPLGRTFTSSGCVGVCTSTISQEDADLCAARQASQCVINPPCVPPCGPAPPPDNPVCVTPGGCPPGPPPVVNPPGCPPGGCPPPPVAFCNGPISCCVPCPDGSLFCYSVPPCMFFAESVAAANVIANSYACKQAAASKLCMRAVLPDVCTGDEYHGLLIVEGGSSRFFNWTLVSGSLPPGLTIEFRPINQLFVTGTPTDPGEFTFTVRATDQRGNFMQRTFTILILEMTSGTPPEGTVGQPYSFQFTAAGGTPPYFFQITLGQLPDGLTLSQDGLLSGTPTTDETESFKVCVSDSGGISEI